MKNSKLKRVLSVVLAALMTMTAIPTTAFAALPDDMPSEMKENVYLDALAYTGYDVQAQIDDGSLYSTLSLIHISEPTRRTPISYAVFCLKKKKRNKTNKQKKKINKSMLQSLD